MMRANRCGAIQSPMNQIFFFCVFLFFLLRVIWRPLFTRSSIVFVCALARRCRDRSGGERAGLGVGDEEQQALLRRHQRQAHQSHRPDGGANSGPPKSEYTEDAVMCRSRFFLFLFATLPLLAGFAMTRRRPLFSVVASCPASSCRFPVAGALLPQ